MKKPPVKPFKAWFFNKNKVGDYKNVICPPYDIIDKKKQSFYYNQSPYNSCRILLKEESAPTYTKLALRFNEWLKKDIFVQDTCESFYFYRQNTNLTTEHTSA